ncbi:MAG: purine-cytosine permease family protein [Saccharofermentanales bacterium]|jgi:cytosine permease
MSTGDKVTTNELNINEAGMTPIPLNKRESWLPAAIVWAGCEFTISVIMGGAGLVSGLGTKRFLFTVLGVLLLITWPTDALNSYVGAVTGRSSTAITRSSFGALQSRTVISGIITFNVLGWWGIQTAVTGDALCALLGIDYSENKLAFVLLTIVAGIVFAIPAIMGYTSIKIVDYIAVPAGLLFLIAAFYLAIKDVGFGTIWNYTPAAGKAVAMQDAIGVLVGTNVSQMIIMADYTRNVKPEKKHAFLVPLGVVTTGFLLFMMGAAMGVGRDTYDIVKIMQELGFGWWGFIVLWLAQWTSQLVNGYSLGLSACNMANVKTERGRKITTSVAIGIALVAALLGILDRFTDFLILTSLLFPPVGSIMVVDVLILNKKKWQDKQGWNWVATVALVVGLALGYVTQYVYRIGIPAVQSYLITGALYYILSYYQTKSNPNGVFAAERFKS